VLPARGPQGAADVRRFRPVPLESSMPIAPAAPGAILLAVGEATIVLDLTVVPDARPPALDF